MVVYCTLYNMQHGLMNDSVVEVVQRGQEGVFFELLRNNPGEEFSAPSGGMASSKAPRMLNKKKEKMLADMRHALTISGADKLISDTVETVMTLRSSSKRKRQQYESEPTPEVKVK